MSQKINIGFILIRHCKSAFCDASSGHISYSDLLIFALLPAATAALVYSNEISDKASTISLLTSVCAIFAGLLLNLLVLVYDQNKRASEKLLVLTEKNKGNIKPALTLKELQETKIDNPDSSVIDRLTIQKSLLGELVVNISYSIIISVFASVLCMIAFLAPAAPSKKVVSEFIWAHISALDYKSILFALAVFLTANLVLTLLMIVKRVFKLMDDD